MKPKIIAWSKGLTVIPFENVTAVIECHKVDGQVLVGLNSVSKESALALIEKQDAQDFVDQYNTYLATVEGLTMQARLVPDNGEES